MSDEYDIYAEIDAFCNSNKLAKFATKTKGLVYDETEDYDQLESPANSLPSLGKKTKKKNVQVSADAYVPPAKGTTKKSSNEILPVKETAVVNTRGRKKKNAPAEVASATEPVVVVSLDTFNNTTAGASVMNTRGRARRSYMAELAARSTNVDFVDMVTSPIPPIHGVITIDSDDDDIELKSKETSKDAIDLDTSFDTENPEMSIKIKLNGKIEIFKLRKYQKFEQLFKTVAEREGTSVEHLVFMLDNKIIESNDSPASINYRIFQFISGLVLTSTLTVSAPNSRKKNRNQIEVKIQSDQWKRPIPVQMERADTFKILYIKCSEELKIPYTNFKLHFDGELLRYSDSPADIDMEGGEAIDCIIKK